MPKVSVLLPLYNCENTVSATMDSLCDQTYGDFEVIAIDNNCSDNTMAVVGTYDDRLLIRYFTCETPGIVAALNTGLKEVYSDYIARIDGDDTWHREKLAKQIEFLEMDPEIGVVGTQIEIYDTQGNELLNGTMNNPVVYATDDNTMKVLMLMGQNPICHPSVVMRRKLFDLVGGYEDLFPKAEDLHLWLRLIPHTKFSNIDEKLTRYTQKQDDDYDARIPLVVSNMYYTLYKTVGLVDGERPKRIYEWQLDPTHHGNVK